MNVNPTESVDLKSIAATGSARKLARSAAKVHRVLEFQTIDRSASAPRTTSDRRTPNVDLNAMETSIVPDPNQLATTVSARIHVIMRAESTRTVICVG